MNVSNIGYLLPKRSNPKGFRLMCFRRLYLGFVKAQVSEAVTRFMFQSFHFCPESLGFYGIENLKVIKARFTCQTTVVPTFILLFTALEIDLLPA